MRKTAALVLLCAAACGTGDNVVVGGIGESTVTPVIQFDDIQSVISGRARVFDADGVAAGTSQVVIISNKPQLCDRLKLHPDYFRKPPETYLALILFFPATDHLGTFIPGRIGDEGTSSEIIGVKNTGQPVPPFDTNMPVAPFPVLNGSGYLALRDWSEAPDGEAVGTFYLAYGVPAVLQGSANVPGGFLFSGKFKSTVCTTLDGTLLP
jgi:hypothetical protein